MSKEMIVSASGLETRLAVLEDNQLTEIFIEQPGDESILGNIYKGKVTRVLPGMQAAFVDIGLDRNAFLYVTDFFEKDSDYEELFDKAAGPVSAFFPEKEDGQLDLVEESEKPAAADKATRRTRQISDQTPPNRAWTRPSEANKSGEQRPSKRKTRSREKELPKREAGRGSNRAPEAADRGKDSPPRRELLPETPLESTAFSKRPPNILPVHIAVEKPESGEQPRETDRPGRRGILPLSLRAEPGRRRGPKSRRRRRRATLRTDPDIKHLAVSRTRRSKAGTRSKGGPRLIGDLLKAGQEILTQVAKEPIGSKGARITSHIVLPGRYLVFMPTVDHIGVSRRIEAADERQRLKKMISKLRGEFERGFIVRTAGEGKTEEDFRQDMVYLTGLWEEIRSEAEKTPAPGLVHEELAMVPRIIRDRFSDDFSAIRVDDERLHNKMIDFVKAFNPKLGRKVKRYRKKRAIFEEFGINSEIEEALKSKVWLKTGGYLVINQTEALVAIDVNTGKYVGKTNSLEDTITKTNLAAVKELVRQLRLRDLGGIIVVDFIDMENESNRNKVMDALRKELEKDKSPSTILPFNEFGLVAITRKRTKQSLERTLGQPCSYCEGRGMTRSSRTVCLDIYDEIRRTPSLSGGRGELIIECNSEVGRALENEEKTILDGIKQLTQRQVVVEALSSIHIEEFKFRKSR